MDFLLGQSLVLDLSLNNYNFCDYSISELRNCNGTLKFFSYLLLKFCKKYFEAIECSEDFISDCILNYLLV